jgi:hypothetical protein
MLVTFSKYDATLLAVNMAVFTPPQTKAAIAGLELINVSRTPLNCCVASRKVHNRGATHLLVVLLLLASISATNAMTLATSGFVVLA